MKYICYLLLLLQNTIVITCLTFIAYCDFLYADEEVLKDSQYFLNGMYEFADTSYGDAAQSFANIAKYHPYSPYAHDAMIMEIFVNFLDKEYAKIDGIVETFLILYPRSNNAPYVLYMRAMGRYYTVKDESRYIDAAKETMAFFDEVVRKFPKSIYADDARKKSEYLLSLIQLNDIKIAEFQYNRGNLIAAMKRYHNIIKEYGDALDHGIKKHILIKLEKIYTSLNLDKDTTQCEVRE